VQPAVYMDSGCASDMEHAATPARDEEMSEVRDVEHVMSLPALDSPYGPGAWQQPSREAITIDATHALMDRQTFERLLEYSGSMPSGVYPGKLWRRHDGAHDSRCPPERRRWLLCWYGPVPDAPSKCSINFREALVV
jgi:hypothetical protein